MQPETMIKTAVDNGQAALSEYQSKLLLRQFGLPITHEILATDLSSALDAAQAIGYPVVLKACSAKLMHKSDQELVALKLAGPDDVTREFNRLAKAGGNDLEGILVQEMVSGNRELVVGLTRDSQFGPCVMLGLGGVMTEIYRDMVFRMAPVCRMEVMDMISQLRAKEMLYSFRGQLPADIEALCRCVIGVGQAGLAFPNIAEVDINPLIISKDGRIAAVDALIILQEAN